MSETDLSTIEHLDFTHDAPCEHSHHSERHNKEESAKYVVKAICPQCNAKWVYLLCASGWSDLMKQFMLGCNCGHMCHGSEAMEIIEVLK